MMLLLVELLLVVCPRTLGLAARVQIKSNFESGS
jgi:hypothetical protein